MFWLIYFIAIVLSVITTYFMLKAEDEASITLKGVIIWSLVTFIPAVNVVLVFCFAIIGICYWFSEGEDIILWKIK